MKATLTRCDNCEAAGFFIRNTRNRCMFCGGEIKAIEAIEDLDVSPHVIVDGTSFFGVKSINLQVYHRAASRMVAVPIVWDGDEYTAILPGADSISLGPCFEFENAERLIKEEINHPHL